LTEPTALSVVYLPIEALIPYARNSRTHSDAQVAQIAGSIREFGWTNPVLVDGDGNVIAGHGRILAARQLGMPAVPCIRLGHLTETQRKALVIADNKLALNAGWNDELLSLELRDLADGGFDLGLIGFSGDELADLLADRTEGLTDPDDAPPAPVNPVSVLGDVWLLGRHRIVCGDCTDADVVATCLDGAKPHLMVTDPPYGVKYDPNWRNEADRKGGGKIGARATGVVLNDDRADWREAWALFPGKVAYIWHAGLFAHTVVDSLAACKFGIRAQIVWVKTRHVLSRGHYHPQHEPCLYAVAQDATDDGWADRYDAEHAVAAYAVKDGSPAAWRGGRKQSTVWFIEHIKSDTGHGTQKPVECMRRPIENNSAPGQEVYEPFSGSGTTIIACEMTGRSARAIELNPAYVDVAVKRWQDFTGQLATLEATGAAFADVCEQRYASGEWAANCAGSYDDAVSAARSALEAAE
jgi:DNA modification methylase